MFEEDRAKKLAQLANEKAEKLLQARERHQKDLEFKFLIQSMKREQQEQMKQQNKSMREEHRQKLNDTRNQMVLRNAVCHFMSY